MPTVNRGLLRRLFQGGARLEDFADRLNHVWTSGLLLVLGAVISWKNNYSDPISCCAPAYFTQAHVNYAEKICWNMYTYSDFIPNEKIRLKPNFVKSYYQYVPLILCFQALLFKLPNGIMNILHSFSGVDFHKVNGLTDGYQHLSMTERQNLANQIARYVYRWCTIFPCRLPWRLLTIFWFLVKIMYCINVINQMTYLDRFLNITNVPRYNSASHGVAIYDNIMNNVSWTASPAFPRVIMCHFNIREMTIVRTHSFQCYLNNNPLTERVFMFLWVWILFVAVTTSLSSIVWVILTLLPISRQRYVRRFLELRGDSNEPANIQDVSLVAGVLGEDGVMVLKLIAANSSELLVRDVICGISKRVRRGGTTITSGTIIYPGPSQQPLLEPTDLCQMYPASPNAD